MTTATSPLHAQEVIAQHWDVASIRPFPAVALKALQLTSGTDTSLYELCTLIRSDPAFSAAILKIANSPLIAFRKNVSNVLQAAMLLGFRRLRSIVVTIGLKAYLAETVTPAMASCWRHSLACALIAERSAKWTALDNDFAYTAGILHDIGRIALASLMPQSYARIVERGANDPHNVLELERKVCGIDHCEAGRSLVAAWNLPEAIAEIAACHHDPHAHLNGTASLLAPSCALAEVLGFGLMRYHHPLNYPDVLTGFPESVRMRFPNTPKELAAEIGQEIKVIESA